MKKFVRKIQESNFSAGMGVRGFGDVSGTPKVDYGTDEEDNPHIQRVIAGAEENNRLVKQFVDNHNTTSLLDEPDDNWWAKAGAKGSTLTGFGKDKNSLKEQAIANVTGAAVPGTGDDAQAFPRAKNSYKKENERTGAAIARRLAPLMVAEDEAPPLETGMFAGNKTFKVPPNVFDTARNERAKGKHWRKYMQDSPHYKQIRDHHRKNPKDPIIFENDKTGHMFYAFYGKKR
jgi:hypothetical protein